MPSSDTDFAAMIEPVARELLGEPNRAMSTQTELRFGAHGSLSVDLRKGTYFDHEQGQGGGVLDLVQRETGSSGDERIEWLTDHGFEVADRPRPNGKHTQERTGSAPPGREVAWYDYLDEDGSLLFQVVRFEPKTFRQRKKDEFGRWSWSVRGTKQVPYHLAEISEAIAQEQIVFIVEGEKDVDNLISIGVRATTSAGGAGKWRDELDQYFAGADVVVIADNDPQKKNPKTGALMYHDDGRPILPGQDHASDVAAHLAAVAANVRLLDVKSIWPQCPEKGDISDWLERGGGTVEKLYQIVDKLPAWTPGGQLARIEFIDLPSWEGLPVPERKWLVKERIPAHNVTMLSGDGGVGKTLLALQLVAATVTGKGWIDTTVDRNGPAMFITAEDDNEELHFRLSKIFEAYGQRFADMKDLHAVSLAGKDAALAICDNRGMVKPTALWDALARQAREIKPAIMVIDTAADVFVIEERDRSQVRQCVSLLRGLALDLDCAVILLAHPSLSGMASGSGLSGSTAWNNSVRARLYLKHGDADNPNSRALEVMKANYGPKGEGIALIWKDGLLQVPPTIKSYHEETPEKRADECVLRLVTLHNAKPGLGRISGDVDAGARNNIMQCFDETIAIKMIGGAERHRKAALKAAAKRLLEIGKLGRVDAKGSKHGFLVVAEDPQKSLDLGEPTKEAT